MMLYPPAFVRLIEELEAYELPARRRLLEGEPIAGRAKLVVSVGAVISGATIPPTLSATVTATVCVTITGRGRLKVRKSEAASVGTDRGPAPRSTRARTVKPDRVTGPRPKRSQATIDAVSAKLRAQRQARIEAALPHIDEARANGCIFLRQIAVWLDEAGVRPPQGDKWSKATLSRMLKDTAEGLSA